MSETYNKRLKSFEKKKGQLNRNRHDFLLDTFFQGEDGYTEKEVGRWHLVKQFNKGVNSWEVAIYSPDSWAKREKYLDGYPTEEQETLYSHWKSLGQ